MNFAHWEDVPAEHNRPAVTHRRLFGHGVQVTKADWEVGGEPAPLHRHEGIEQFYLIQEGEWEVTLGDQVRCVGPGDVVYVEPGRMHAIRLMGETPGWFYEVCQPILGVEIAERRGKAGGA